MPYKLVIFDFDGTLADSFPWFVKVFNEVADAFGFKRIEHVDIDRVRSLGSRQILRHFGVPVWKLPAIAAHMRALAARDRDGIRLFDGVDRLLRKLAAQGVTLAIVSSNSEETIRRVLGPANAALIAYYECGASLFGKRAKFRKLIRATGVPRAEVICIGDELRDLEAAREEKVAFGAVSWGYASLDAFAGHRPAAVFYTLDDILDRVASR